MNIDSKTLQTILDKGESVEWTARPEPFKAIDEHNKQPVLIRDCICIAVIAAILIFYIVSTFKNGSKPNIWLILILLAIGTYLVILPLLDARIIAKKRLFMITDRHVISFENESNCKKMLLSDVDAVKFIDKGNGIGDVIFGSAAIKYPYSRIHVLTIIPRESSDGTDSKIVGMAFYNVAGFENVRSLLPKGIPVAECKLSEMK